MNTLNGNKLDKPLRILLIDDDPYDLDYIQSMLEQVPSTEFSLVAVGCLDDGLNLIANGHYDAVISDLQLPGAAGLAGIRAIRREKPNVPILVVTGMAGALGGEAALEAGADGIIEKDSLTVEAFVDALLVVLAKDENLEAT